MSKSPPAGVLRGPVDWVFPVWMLYVGYAAQRITETFQPTEEERRQLLRRNEIASAEGVDAVLFVYGFFKAGEKEVGPPGFEPGVTRTLVTVGFALLIAHGGNPNRASYQARLRPPSSPLSGLFIFYRLIKLRDYAWRLSRLFVAGQVVYMHVGSSDSCPAVG